MASRSKTESFVTEIELLPTGKQVKKLRSKFEAARLVYNAAMGEARKRMRESRAWQATRKMPKGKERNSEFKRLKAQFGFREYDLHSWGKQFTASWINPHIRARTVEATITRAFKAAEEHLHHPDRKHLRFRRKGELRSVEGKTKSCCHWKGDRIEWGRGFVVKARIESNDPVQQHGLTAKVKYVRVVRRVIREHERFFAQLVCEGSAYRKAAHQPAEGVVGLDVGTQTVAIVGESVARLKCFCPEVDRGDKRVRRIQRAMDRSRRAMNPINFREDGGIAVPPRGQRLTWVSSHGYQRLRTRLSELLRKEADHRKNLHGQLVAEVLSFGNDVRFEKLQYRSWAKKAKRDGNRKRKRFGKSVGRRAPGMFIARLKTEADKWGARWDEFPTRTTRLSQTCHCGHRARKTLGQRTHKCPKCGAFAQRDLYSAYLARFVENGTLHADQASKAWSRNCAALGAAWSEIKHANGLPASLGLRDRDRAACSQNGIQNSGEGVDAVTRGKPTSESHAEPLEKCQSIAFFADDAHSTFANGSDYKSSGADSG